MKHDTLRIFSTCVRKALFQARSQLWSKISAINNVLETNDSYDESRNELQLPCPTSANVPHARTFIPRLVLSCSNHDDFSHYDKMGKGVEYLRKF